MLDWNIGSPIELYDDYGEHSYIYETNKHWIITTEGEKRVKVKTDF